MFFVRFNFYGNLKGLQLASNQANQVSAQVLAATPTIVEPVLDEPVKGVTFANADNLLTARQPTSLVEEPTVFMTRAKVKAVLRREKEKASLIIACLNLKPSYPT